MYANPELGKRTSVRGTEALPETEDLDPRPAVALGAIAREAPAQPAQSVSSSPFIAAGLFALLGALAIIPIAGVR